MTQEIAPAMGVARGDEMLVFRVGTEHFAAPLTSVEEALDLDPGAVQPLPGENPAFRGVFTLREALVPVFAPHRALGVDAGDGDTVLVIRPRQGSGRAAIVVDDVEDVMTLAADELRAEARADAGAVIRGVVQREQGIVAIVDLNALVGACRTTDGGDGR